MESQILELHGAIHAESLWRRSARTNLAPEFVRFAHPEITDPAVAECRPWSPREASPNRR